MLGRRSAMKTSVWPLYLIIGSICASVWPFTIITSIPSSQFPSCSMNFSCPILNRDNIILQETSSFSTIWGDGPVPVAFITPVGGVREGHLETGSVSVPFYTTTAMVEVQVGETHPLFRPSQTLSPLDFFPMFPLRGGNSVLGNCRLRLSPIPLSTRISLSSV